MDIGNNRLYSSVYWSCSIRFLDLCLSLLPYPLFSHYFIRMHRALVLRTWLFIGFLFLTGSVMKLCAQKDTLALPTVTVQEKPIFSGEQIDQSDEDLLRQQPATHVGEILAQSTGVFVKSFGGGSSATTSIRGGSAEHTRVLWNGLPIENPMLGQLDFSLLPAIFIDEVAVHYGGNTATWGNGAIGGTVQLDNKTDWQKKNLIAQYTATNGAFGLAQQGLKIGYGNEKFQFINRIFHQKAENDFTYFISENLPRRQQTNAATKQWGSLQEFHYKITPRQTLNAYFWYQTVDRQLPPHAAQNQSVAFQVDETKRLSADWQYAGDDWLIKAQTAWYEEDLRYVDSLSGIDDLSRFNTLLGQFTGTKNIGQIHRLTMGLQNTFYQANTDLYEDGVTQNRIAIWLDWKTKWKKLSLELSVRQEWQDEKRLPLVPSFGAVYRPWKWATFRGRVSRNYRSPNLNALYYFPTGNPDLLPESGWSRELGLDIHFIKASNWTGSYSITGFRRDIKNWIRWILPEGSFSYAPTNIVAVRSEGIEHRLDLTGEAQNTIIKVSFGYNQLRSIHKKSIARPQIAAGSQLVYTPKQQFFSTLKINHHAALLIFQHRFTGEVSTLNNHTLPGYHLSDLTLGYLLKTKRWQHQLSLRINNLWNKNYRVLERRGMPGRHLSFSLNTRLF